MSPRLIITIGMLCLSIRSAQAGDWPQFRGPGSNSTSLEELQVDWSAPNVVKWRSPLPGRGPSSPIVVGDRVFVTASSGVNQDRLHVLCFDAGDGKKLWERQFWATGRTITHPSSANAAPTPASDGKRIFAFFSSNDLAALDLEGNLLWYRGLAIDFPLAGNDVGMSSSPVVVGDTVVVQVENQSNSFAAGVNTQTGETRWHVDRTPAASWCSPIAMRRSDGGSHAVLLQSSDRLTAHDPKSGKELWIHKANCDVIPTTAVDGSMLFVPSDGMTALDIEKSETSPASSWIVKTLMPGAASPVVGSGRLFIINRGGVLNCADTSSGKVLWKLRLEGSFWGTPTLAGNQLIACADNGLLQIVGIPADGSAGVVNDKVDLRDKIQSSPAVANGAVYLRSDSALFKLQ